MKVHDLKKKKLHREKISVITCYDFPSAEIIAESNIDCVLVGDSVAMTVHGYETTIMATVDMMALHTNAVARGLNKQFLISDLPFLAHRGSKSKIITNVSQLLQAGAHAVKIEGGDEDTCETIRYLVKSGIPIMGHIGLTAQYIHQLGGYKVQGKNLQQQELLLSQAQSLQQAGCFSLVLECIPENLAKEITSNLLIPTIGIGAGVYTDGQVLVWHDLLGLQTKFQLKFVKQYLQGKTLFLEAINRYVEEIKSLNFPALEHTYMDA